MFSLSVHVCVGNHCLIGIWEVKIMRPCDRHVFEALLLDKFESYNVSTANLQSSSAFCFEPDEENDIAVETLQ